MKFEQVKKDMVIKHRAGGEYRVKMIGTDRRIAVRREGESSPVYFINESQLSYYEPKSNFFRIGKKYMLGNRADKWLVLEVYQVDNPAHSWGKMKAVAKMITPDGKYDIQTLSVDDFARMREV